MPNPRLKWLRKTRRSPSYGCGSLSSLTKRTARSATGGNRMVLQRYWMSTSVALEPTHDPLGGAISREA